MNLNEQASRFTGHFSLCSCLTILMFQGPAVSCFRVLDVYEAHACTPQALEAILHPASVTDGTESYETIDFDTVPVSL
jgi:hypothetical protein